MVENQSENRICIEGEACDTFHSIVGDMLETIESLRTAAGTFPDGYTTAPGQMNAAITVRAFASSISGQLDKLYSLATGNAVEPGKEGGNA